MTRLKNVNFDLSVISQRIIFIGTIQKDFRVAEEMLDLIPLNGTTKGTEIFETVNKMGGHTTADTINVLELAITKPEL